ncbi:MAG: DctP family TRAP transporter solute-binding subunit [Planctomycetes bacterium]|nr:DctP family TRAP transporter solute-binding subunit [Planctomycetota bacterium]
MKRIIALVLGLVLIAGTVARAGERNVTLKLSNVTSQSAIDAGVVFKKIAEEASGGSLTINLFDNNQLGDDRVVIEGTIFGDIDIAVSSTSPMATMFSDFYVFDAPYLFLTTEHAYAGLDGEAGQKILAGMEGKGLKGLAFWENGFRNFTNSKLPVRLPPDVAGMKIRTMENEIHLAAWRALGANPTPMAFTELFTALQQGTVDGEENPLGIIDGNKFQEVQEYLSMTQHVYTPYIVCMNLDKYNSLSDTQKAAIDKAARESTTWQRDRSQELEKEIKVRFAEVGTVIDLDDSDKEAWQKVIVDAKIFDLVKEKMDNPDYLDIMLQSK